MLTEAQRQRFRALQQREEDGTLSLTEKAVLQAFVEQIEAGEAAYLRPAVERMRQERLQVEAQTKALHSLLRRKERLARRLERILALSASEREKINAQVSAILNAGPTGATK
jgi:hypothetical protein